MVKLLQREVSVSTVQLLMLNVRRFHSSKEDESVQITNKLLHSVSTAQQKCRDQLAENKKAKNQECIRNQKCILLDKIREVMAKRDELQKTWKLLEAEYVALVTLAEKEMNMSHVIKANTLKWRCVDIESEVTKLDETVLLLEEKKRKLK